MERGPIRLRFFRDLRASERLKFFKVFGILPDDFDEDLSHSSEDMLLTPILAAITSTAIRDSAIEEALKVVEEVIEEGRMGEIDADLRCIGSHLDERIRSLKGKL